MLNEELYQAYIDKRINDGADRLTRTQNEWLLWLFEEDSIKQIEKVGNLPSIFKDVFNFIRK